MSAARRWALAAALLLQAGSAFAVLGEGVASVHRDAHAAPADRRQALALRVQTYERTLADGGRMREYVSPAGVVFAVDWHTHTKPDLQALLGRHYGNYQIAGRAAALRGVQRSLQLQQGDLVVQSSSHLNVFAGRAWLRSALPQGVSVDALR